MDEAADGAQGRFLIGYWLVRDPAGMRVIIAGQLGGAGADLLEACRVRLAALPVCRIRFDLTALLLADETGARSLAAMFSALRRDSFQVDMQGPQATVDAVLTALSHSGNGRPPGPRSAIAAARHPQTAGSPAE